MIKNILDTNPKKVAVLMSNVRTAALHVCMTTSESVFCEVPIDDCSSPVFVSSAEAASTNTGEESVDRVNTIDTNAKCNTCLNKPFVPITSISTPEDTAEILIREIYRLHGLSDEIISY